MLLALGLFPPRLDRLRALWPFVVVAVAGGLVFAWMCDAVGDRNGITAVDGPVSVWFASHRSATEGQLGLLLAKLTSPAALVTLVLVAAALLYWRGHRSESTVLVGSTFLAYGVGALAKIAEHRARPVAPVNLAPESEASFPSGHVLVVTTVAFLVLGLAWTWLSRAGRVAATTVAVGVTLAVAVDRLVVGAHWLTDVLGSLALAGVIVSVVLAAHRLLQPEGVAPAQ